MSALFDESAGEVHGVHGIQIGVDDTDHIAFFCPKCGSAMAVRKVQTRRKMLVNTRTGKTDNCTYVYCNAIRVKR
jgi:predicted RNA-binding Zn-ribbon protein involved in translation (DUF1610 family)